MNCIDAGSENCPCYLAVTGDCLVCSRLQGKDYCNCNWHGVCIYNEFMQGNRKVNNPRKDFEARIAERKFYKEDLVVFTLDVGKGFAMKAGRPGSYLFVKGSGAISYYDIPISVMKADVEKGQIHLAIKIISTKTKALLSEENKLALRGPYRNGVHGISSIMKKKGRNFRTLVIAKGIGIAPGILASGEFQQKGSVDMIVDTEKISEALIDDYLGSANGMIRYMSLTEKSSGRQLSDIMKKNQYDNVILLVSDHYIDTIGRMIKKTLPAADLAVSNNFHICCGEGLCGSCSIDTSGGDTVKMCKCQLNGADFLSNVFYSRTSG
jgi:NAD(P)H-flavin reductase